MPHIHLFLFLPLNRSFYIDMQQFSVFRWGHAFELSEQAAEIKGIVIAHKGRDLSHAVIGGFQQAGSIVHPDRQQILHGRMVYHLFEVSLEVADTHVPRFGIVLDGDRLVIVLIEIAASIFHLLLYIGGHGRALLLLTVLLMR